MIRKGFASVITLLIGLSLIRETSAQEHGITVAERLGWEKGAVVVLLHIDDAGMSHASNMGVKEAMLDGVASSFSIMMPCSWVPEMAELISKNPDWDSGIHLTFTSEWNSYRWGPLSGLSQVPGLVDPQGCFWPSVRQVVEHASPDEIEAEIRAQIARAERLGIPIALRIRGLLIT